ncbi:MAG: ribosome small subunit-dependent GTPase A [Simkaniaceae bacterium]
MGKDNYLEFEEEYHGKCSSKEERLEKKRIRKRDRSKYKKSNQKKEAAALDPDLKIGRVLSTRGQIIEVYSDHTLYECALKGSLKQEKGLEKNLVVIGDFVRFYPKIDEISLIVHVDERLSVLSRRSSFKGHQEQMLAANIDQLFIVVSYRAPSLKPSLIDRYIIAARRGRINPIVVINKCDLMEESSEIEHLEATYQKLKIPFVKTSALTGRGLDTIKELMALKASVFSGQSGTGKTSIINKLTGLDLSVREVVAKTQKGAHTTTAATLIPLENEAFLIDTPGIKSFGMWDLDKSEVQNYFSEIKEVSFACKFPNCSHSHEPGCAVKEAVDEGSISKLRFQSYLSLISSEDA